MKYSAIGISCMLLAIAASPLSAQSKRNSFYARSLAPYVPTPPHVVERMLEIAHLKPGETVYDLGCGDGRILIAAVKHFHAKAVGVELSDELATSTEQKIASLGLQNDARVIHGDLLDVDLGPANVVTIYLMTESNDKLRPNLERELKPGSRVVSHDYSVPGWKPNLVEKAEGNSRAHLIYLYIMPPTRQ